MHNGFSIGLMTLLLACSSGSGDGGGGGTAGSGGGGAAGGAGATGGSGGGGGGTSTCGSSQCQAGQHCFNTVCINGCLTAQNCTSNQNCEDIDPLTSIGTCKDKPVAPTKDCNALCNKMQACMDPDWVICSDICTAASAECVTCYVASNCGEGCDDTC